MPRREFPAKVRVAAFKRANGRCEGCGVRLTVGRFIYDHRIPDQIGGEPTLENCQVLGWCCDKPKTAKDQGVIAKVKRIEARHLGANRPRSRLPCGRDSIWKRTIDGRTIRRDA
jgi:5-methylcytosine-specific restriction protein A